MGFLSMFKTGNKWSMSQLLIFIVMLTFVVLCIFSTVKADSLRPIEAGVLCFCLLAALANRANSRNLTIRFKDLELTQEMVVPEPKPRRVHRRVNPPADLAPPVNPASPPKIIKE